MKLLNCVKIYNIIGIIDNNLKEEYFGYPVLGSDNDAKNIFVKYKDVPVVITPDLPSIRVNLACYYFSIGFKFENIISSNAKISKTADIGNGLIIQNGVNISSKVSLGNFVKLNTNANIMHDSIIGDYVTIAPNVVILGRVNIEKNSYIGANSTILPDIKINHNVIVGAGAVVTRDVLEGKVVKGIPAK